MMVANYYLYFKLLHIFAALAFFALQGVYFLREREFQGAKEGAALDLALKKMIQVSSLFAPVSMTLLASGLVMVFTVWGFKMVWVNLSLGLFLANLLLAICVDKPLLAKTLKSLGAQDGTVTADLLEDKLMRFSHTFKMGADFTLVFLMTVKPGLTPAFVGLATFMLLAMGVETFSVRRRVQAKLQTKAVS